MQLKIEDLISEIQVKRQKSRESSDTSSDQGRYRKKWSTEQQHLLCDLLVRFGTDFTLLKGYFPQKTRQQIKKKYREINNFRQKKLDKMESEFLRERRKSFFDEMLEEGEAAREKRETKQPDLQQQSFL